MGITPYAARGDMHVAANVQNLFLTPDTTYTLISLIVVLIGRWGESSAFAPVSRKSTISKHFRRADSERGEVGDSNAPGITPASPSFDFVDSGNVESRPCTILASDSDHPPE